MVEKKSIPCTFLFSGYRLVNIQGGIFVWKKERKIKYGVSAKYSCGFSNLMNSSMIVNGR